MVKVGFFFNIFSTGLNLPSILNKYRYMLK